MASELRVNTLKDASGNNSIATSVVFGGTAKAWVNINGDASTPAFHSGSDNINISSITDVATGRYTVTMTNNFENAFYQQANHGGYRDDADGQDYGFTLGTYAYGSKTSSANPLAFTYYNGSQYEADHGMFTFFGDLA